MRVFKFILSRRARLIFKLIFSSIITGILYVSLMDSLTNEDHSIISDGSTNQTITNEKSLKLYLFNENGTWQNVQDLFKSKNE